jgi:PIN domain nuclease of toxin-antitoxin system
MASAWEMAIKASIGKLEIEQPLETLLPKQLEQNDIALLPISLPHVMNLMTLPFHHRDPFDRLIIARGMVDGLIILSADPVFEEYGIDLIR